VISISSIQSREILDSRGRPTIETLVKLSDDSVGKAAVPSGTSTGSNEAVELRDGDQSRFMGMGVLKAIDNVHTKIAPVIKGLSPFDQIDIDKKLVDLDGTDNKSHLGANAMLSVSLSICHAAAASMRVPLYKYLSVGDEVALPVPMFNILNGGAHALNSTDIQEFLVIPSGLPTFREAMRAGVEIYQTLKSLLLARGLNTNVGDEGGFAPTLESNRAALEIIVDSVEKAGYIPGTDCHLGLDVAATGLLQRGKYYLPREDRLLTSDELINRYKNWSLEFPLLSIEDGLSEDDWDGWCKMSRAIGSTVQLVGDDIYTTNPKLINKGVALNASNAVLLKPNQIGTLTETIEAFKIAREADWGTILSHRSGETEDTTIADLSVALNVGQIKAGAPCRSERLAKYNRLLMIEYEMGSSCIYSGMEAYKHVRGKG